MFWLVWAECTLLLHLFDYGSVWEMPAVSVLYVVLTPVLVAVALVCWLCPARFISLGSWCSSCWKGNGSGSSYNQQHPPPHTSSTHLSTHGYSSISQ